MRSTSSTGSRGRERRLALTLLLAIISALVYVAAEDRDGTSAALRGDFPAFYAAAVLSASNSLSELYDIERQREIENRAWPSLNGSVLVYAYPPYIAALLSPLAALAPTDARLLHLGLSLAALIISALLIARAAPGGSRADPLVIAAVLLGFAPLLHGTLGGQNTAFSLLCLSGAYSALIGKQESRSDLVAGLWLGVWLFKPNLSLIVIAAVAAAGRLRVLAGVFAVALTYEVLALLVFGFWWLRPWLDAAVQFQRIDLVQNSAHMISLGGAGAALGSIFSAPAAGLHAGIALSIVLAVFAAVRLRRSRLAPEILWLAVPAALLISPHTMYYDAALCLAPMFALGLVAPQLSSRAVLGLLAAAALAVALKENLPVQPLTLLPLALFWMTFRLSRANGTVE